MVRLTCVGCGLSYAAATLPQYLAASAGASCPRCGTPLTDIPETVAAVPRFGAVTYRRRRLSGNARETAAKV